MRVFFANLQVGKGHRAAVKGQSDTGLSAEFQTGF